MNYPKAQIPTQQILNNKNIQVFDSKFKYPSVLDIKYARFVTSGRAAITLAMEMFNTGPDNEVLAPAYHCNAMIEPIIHLGAKPVFYKINKNTSVDLGDIQTKITQNTRVLMITHYFGFHQNIQEIRTFCDEHNLFLLEDCAHAFLGKTGDYSIGYYGDAAIASAMKFFPVYDGGCLVSNNSNINSIKLNDANRTFQLKAAINCFEKAFEYGQLPFLRIFISIPLRIKDFLWQKYKEMSPKTTSNSLGPGASEGSYGLDPTWLHKRISKFSKYIIKNSNLKDIADKRRKNYQYIDDAIKDISGITPLFHQLPDDVVPYVYPAIVDNPERLFPALKMKGVPIIRFGEFLWEGVDNNTCPVSVELSRKVFQFPCHQSLTIKQLDWMLEQIKFEL